MKLLDDDPDIPAQINIVSAIDVIFAILAFFIISSLFLTRNEGLPVNLPQAQSSQVQQETRITVSVTAEGEIRVDEDGVTLETLQDQVRQQMAAADTSLVVLNADEAIPHGQAIAIMDRLRQIENLRLAIATQSHRNPSE
ncbi:biopolymer transporter ExbD [Phormidium yuhuli AB48]|uniref:Biopolymer transporter ExbD n=1 Tax=Phormidium yuhuli AB48 TaxID=2940671 RepID=A0ABY5AP94_9CYAN|nr:biopolymer transporter ExbD [Phormidium yuhuli]USR91034.1 biopolymer transporter ExbD [Phormidium yuhuli AB48]